MLGLYDQLLAKTGSHTQTARLLRTDRASLPFYQVKAVAAAVGKRERAVNEAGGKT